MNEQTRNEIIRRWHAGASMRAMARDLGLARDTVRRAVAQHQEDRATGPQHPDMPKRPRKRGSLLDPYQRVMEDLVQRYPSITIMRMLEELRTHGFRGGYTVVRLRLRELRPRPRSQLVIRFETAPGAQAQMDYGSYELDFSHEGRRRVSLFGYLLGYSRRRYLRFVESQDFQTTVREHIRAFEHLGGVAATCLYDNMKVVVLRYEGDEPIYNPQFLAFATHYGFKPWACRPHRPQTKGKIEKQFRFVETSLLNGRTFRSVEHLNEVTVWWLANVADVQIHRGTKRSPLELHAEELPYLLPLPQKPYDVAQVVYRTVNAEGFIAYRQNAYSVPWQHVGRVLPVRITEDELIVYGPDIDEIGRHPLLPHTATGQRSEQKDHRPQQDLHLRYVVLQERFAELGPTASRFFEGLVQEHRRGKDQAHKVLVLGGTYRREDLIAALERAVRFGAYSLRAVERILAVQARPKTPLESQADEERDHLRPLLENGPVKPRTMQEYQQMLFEERPTNETPPEKPSDQSTESA